MANMAGAMRKELAALPPTMTLRDYFAAAALTGIQGNSDYQTAFNYDKASVEGVAEHCYRLADAMLSAREEGKA